MNFILGLSIVGFLSFFGVKIGDASVLVTGANQPSATLAAQEVIMEFTNFTVRPNGKDVKLAEVVVERTGISSTDAIDKIMLIAKKSASVDEWEEGRVIATGVFDGSGTVRLKNSYDSNDGLRSFNQTAKFTIAAVMKSDLSSYAGSVIYLTVKKIKLLNSDGKRMKVKGKLPITGAGHTVNSSLNTGSATVNIEYNVGHMYAIANITAGSVESILLEKIFIRQTGEFPESANLYFTVLGEKYKFSRGEGWFYLSFKEILEIGKGESVSAQIETDSASGLPKVKIRPEDLIISGKTYGYKIYPEVNLIEIGGGGQDDNNLGR